MKYEPQLAKPPSKSQTLQTGPDWIVERKWDGMRAIFEIGSDSTRIFSRTGQDLCPQFPELCDLHTRIPVPCILDGEIVALTEANGRVVEDLELLQLRLGDKLARRRDEVPVEVRFFDVLEFFDAVTARDADVRGDSLRFRRSYLERILRDTEFEMPELLATPEIPSHWEGVIAKRADSPYRSGKRSAEWLKFKFTQRGTFRVSGLTAGKGARASSFGALTFEDAHGVHRGQVGSGFPAPVIAEIMAWAADESPECGDLLIEVEYRFVSKSGLLVNTAFKGIRRDKVEADAL